MQRWASWEGCLMQSIVSRGNPRSSDQLMLVLSALYPPWRHHLGASLLLSISSPTVGCFGGNPRSGSPRSDDGYMWRRSLPWGIILELMLAGGALRRTDLHVPR
jgi:hypothetical protein